MILRENCRLNVERMMTLNCRYMALMQLLCRPMYAHLARAAAAVKTTGTDCTATVSGRRLATEAICLMPNIADGV